jgi:hypothetical protein
MKMLFLLFQIDIDAFYIKQNQSRKGSGADSRIKSNNTHLHFLQELFYFSGWGPNSV